MSWLQSFFTITPCCCSSNSDGTNADEDAVSPIRLAGEFTSDRPIYSEAASEVRSKPSASQILVSQLSKLSLSSAQSDKSGYASLASLALDKSRTLSDAELANKQDPSESVGVEQLLKEEAELRGVFIDEFYDCYDVCACEHHVRRMSEGLAGRATLFSSAGSNSAGSNSTSSGHGTSSSESDVDNTSTTISKSMTDDMTIDTWKRGTPEQEIITRWGVLAAILIRSCVIGFGDVAEGLLHQNKQMKNKVRGYRLMSSVKRRAQHAFDAAHALGRRLAQEDDCLDSLWTAGNLLPTMFTTEYVDSLLILANSARQVFAMQPMLVKVSAPCKIFGDIHGQLRDLLLLFNVFGYPDADTGPCYVFNGDFVDRGKWQLEVIGLLFALKVLMPEKVWLLRGNHEDREMNEKYGFREDCRSRLGKEFGLKTYDHMHKAFDQLPVACVVAETVLVVHGGLGDGRWTLRDVETLKRPLGGSRLYDTNWIYNILWSDPLDEETDDGAMSSTFGVHASPRRQNVVQFGWNVTKVFCARNGIGLVVRSHECKLGGMGFDVMHERRLIRVFSARDYEGNGNSAAVLFIRRVAEGSDAEQSLLSVRPQVLTALAYSGSSSQEKPRISKKQPPSKLLDKTKKANISKKSVQQPGEM